MLLPGNLVQGLVKEVRQLQRLLKYDKDRKPHFIDEPFITIASRLQPWQYEQGWLEYSHRQFTGRFLADGMLLLKKKNRRPCLADRGTIRVQESAGEYQAGRIVLLSEERKRIMENQEEQKPDTYLKSRGAQINTRNRFLKNERVKRAYRGDR